MSLRSLPPLLLASSLLPPDKSFSTTHSAFNYTPSGKQLHSDSRFYSHSKPKKTKLSSCLTASEEKSSHLSPWWTIYWAATSSEEVWWARHMRHFRDTRIRVLVAWRFDTKVWERVPETNNEKLIQKPLFASQEKGDENLTGSFSSYLPNCSTPQWK